MLSKVGCRVWSGAGVRCCLQLHCQRLPVSHVFFRCCSLLLLQVFLEVWGEADSLEGLHAAVAQFCPKTKAQWGGPEQVFRGNGGRERERQSVLQLGAGSRCCCLHVAAPSKKSAVHALQLIERLGFKSRAQPKP